MYRLGMGTVSPSECAGSFWTYLTSSSCWANDQPKWAQIAAMEQTGPAAPTTAQLQAVASGEMTADQLTQTLANQQAQSMQSYMSGQVQPVTDVYSTVDSALSTGSGTNSGACSMSIISSVCDSTVLLGGALGIGILFLLFSMRR